eukprot:gene4129-2637_t
MREYVEPTVRLTDEGGRPVTLPIATELKVRKAAGAPLGAEWAGGATELRGARPGGALAAAAAPFVGRTVTHVNGAAVATSAQIDSIADPALEVVLTFAARDGDGPAEGEYKLFDVYRAFLRDGSTHQLLLRADGGKGKSAACVAGPSFICNDEEFGDWTPVFDGLQEVDGLHRVGDVPARAGCFREHLKDKVL